MGDVSPSRSSRGKRVWSGSGVHFTPLGSEPWDDGRVLLKRDSIDGDRVECLVAREDLITGKRRVKRVKGVQPVVHQRGRLEQEVLVNVDSSQFQDCGGRLVTVDRVPLADPKAFDCGQQ